MFYVIVNIEKGGDSMKRKIFTLFCAFLTSCLILSGCQSQNNTKESTDQKTAVVYFSITGNTKRAAEEIASVQDIPTFEIKAKEPYTEEDLNYKVEDARVNQEQGDESSRPQLAEAIDISEYDTIYLGYPIWGDDVPKIILSFLDEADCNGKTIIPFCTSGGSGIENSVKTLKGYGKDIEWKEGQRFASDFTSDEIKDWLESL